MLRQAAAQFIARSPGQVEIFRPDFIRRKRFRRKFTDRRRRRRRNFITAILAIDNHAVTDTEGSQDMSHGLDQTRCIDAEDLIYGVSRIGQRPQDIEDSVNAQLFADSIDAFHHVVVIPRIKITKADLLEHVQTTFGTEEDIGPQGLQDIGRPAARRLGPIAMLGDADAAGGDDERCRRRDIEGLSPAAASTDDIEDVHRAGNVHTILPHSPGKSRDFFFRRAFRRQGC